MRVQNKKKTCGFLVESFLWLLLTIIVENLLVITYSVTPSTQVFLLLDYIIFGRVFAPFVKNCDIPGRGENK